MKRMRIVGVALLASVAALSSCGTVSKVTTAHAVSNSFANLGKQSGLSLTFSLGVSASQVHQMDSTVSSQAAQAISTGAIFLKVKSGHGEAVSSAQYLTDSNNSFDFGLTIGSSSPIELRAVGGNFYLRADISGLLQAVGLPANKASSVQGALQKADQYVPGLAALGQGQWVEVTKASLQQLSGLLKQYESALGGSNGAQSSGQLTAGVKKLMGQVLTAFKNNATYKNAGTSGGRTHYQLILALQPFVQQVGADVSTWVNSVPGGSLFSSKITSGVSKAAAKIPATQTATIDEYVQNNLAEEIDVDLNQFAGSQKVSGPVPLKLVIGTNPDISAPAGATALDLSKLPQLLSGLAGKLG